MIGRLLGDESGMTLPELMVASLISMLVGALMVMVITTALSVDDFTREDSQALAELRTATERFEKEVRQARKVYGPTVDDPVGSTGTRIRFWVDYNRNNQQDLEDQIIWEQVLVGDRAVLRRTNAAGSFETLVNSGLTPGTPFSYNLAPPDTTVVTITLIGDVKSGSTPSGRTVRTKVRLRNAAF
jgi:type II secretory pathway pseudopilin PulG